MSDSGNHKNWALLSQFLVAAVEGAISGAILAAVICNLFPSFFRRTVWSYVWLGAGFGAVSGVLSRARRIRRDSRLAQFADQVGMDVASNSATALRDKLERLLATDDSLSFKNLMVKEIGEARILLGDMIRVRRNKNNATSTNQTIAFLDCRGLDLPQFTLQPEGTLLRVLERLTGEIDIDFGTHPQFSSAYHLSGRPEERVRQLFTDSLLDFLSQHTGWELRGDGDQVLLLRPRQLVSSDEINAFLVQAQEIFGRLSDASAGIDPSLPASTDARRLRAGFFGNLIQANFVSMQQVEAFVDSPTPRSVPKRILRQRVGAAVWIAIVWGTGFALSGIALLVLGMFSSPREYIMVALGAVGLIIGATAVTLTVHLRDRQMRLLRQGVVTQGTIDSVERTNVAISSRQRYLVHVRYDAAGLTIDSSCPVYGPHVHLARKAAESRQPVQLLYDPTAPRKFILTLQLANEWPPRL